MTRDDHNDARASIDGADFSNARLRSPNFAGARITDAWLRGANISGDVAGLIVNDVDVAPLIEAELDRRTPDRVLLRSPDPDGIAKAWQLVETRWSTTLARAGALSTRLLDVRVDGEWSFVETLRHLIMATDLWLLRMVQGEPRPCHPWGLLPYPTSPVEAASLGLDANASPSYDDVLSVRRGRMAAVADEIRNLTDVELDRVCHPPDSPGHPSSPHTVRKCLHVILDEEWMHANYANRDLDVLEHRVGG